MWVAILSAEISQLKGQGKIAIVMNPPAFEEAEDIDHERGSQLGSLSNRGVDYLITNVEGEKVTDVSLFNSLNNQSSQILQTIVLSSK